MNRIFEFPLSAGGRTLVVNSQEMEGMAGEPMEAVTLTINEEITRFEDVKDQLNPENAATLHNYLEDVNRSNMASALSYIL